MGFDYLSVGDRKYIINQIVGSEENKKRKEESLMRYEIYKSRQHNFVVQKIRAELGAKAAQNSRIISSINLTKKIINEMARVYMQEPIRQFENVSEDQAMHIQELYLYAQANVKLKKANRIYKLADQAALQVVPKDGKIEIRALYPHHYDVIPMANDPEKAECYIISSFDKSTLFQQQTISSDETVNQRGYFSDSVNQKIADPDDYKGSKLYYWWTKDYNFVTNEQGEYVDGFGNLVTVTDESQVANPIGMLNFVDIAMDKDFEFFVRSSNTVTDFSLDFALMLSDTSEVNRLQGFAQAVIMSKEEPKDLKVGPRNYVWMRLDPNDAENARPSFNFVSPNPDLSASLQLLSNMASLFLTSVGQSPNLVNTSGAGGQTFSSGIDRFLAMIEKFEQSQDDVDLFKAVEHKLFKLMKAWNNVYANVTENGFVPELSGVMIPEDADISVMFKGPEMNLSEKEKLDLIQQKLELGISDRLEAIMVDRGVDEKTAQLILNKINSSEPGMLMSGVSKEVESMDEDEEESQEDAEA